MKRSVFSMKSFVTTLFLGTSICLTANAYAINGPSGSAPTLLLQPHPPGFLEPNTRRTDGLFSKIKPSSKPVLQAASGSDCGAQYALCIEFNGQVSAGPGISQCGQCLNECTSSGEWPFFQPGCHNGGG
ncbi:hypothetical protein ACTUSN_16560 [Pantoea ananatis]|uniref:hypothetical protein n=1 Tax=Pantoea ananas TaxID=553 RepID=UPI003FA44F71